MTRGRVVLAGGNGFLGQSLAGAMLTAGWEVDVLTRSAVQGALGRQVVWDGATVGPWTEVLDGAAAIVNLTGRSVNCRYTESNRRAIVDSRVTPIRAIAAGIATCPTPPGAWIQAASLAIYGSPGDTVLDEQSPLGNGFSPDVCRRWEAEFDACDVPQTRRALLRIGIVLGREGGALDTLGRLARWGLGGRIGRGGQYLSWLHADDMDRMLIHAVESHDIAGVYNATGPTPVTNAVFMSTLRQAVGRPWSPPVPAPIVRAGAWLMRTEPELALTGRRCVPARLLEQGFEFRFPDLRGALTDVLG